MKIQLWIRKSLYSRLPEARRMKQRKYICACPAPVLFCWAFVAGWSETGCSRGDPSAWLSTALPAAWLLSSWADSHDGCSEAVFLHVLLSCVIQVIQNTGFSLPDETDPHWDQGKGTQVFRHNDESWETWYNEVKGAAKEKQWQRATTGLPWPGQYSGRTHQGVGNCTQTHFFWDSPHHKPVPYGVGIWTCKEFWIHAVPNT